MTVAKFAVFATIGIMSLPDNYTNYISRIMASITTNHYSLLRPMLLKYYSSIYSADITPNDLKAPSFIDFFTRERSRPILLSEREFVSPCDGQLYWQGTCRINEDIGGMTLQEILKMDNSDKTSLWDYYILYLAPGDYHRFHSPSDLIIDELLHYTGPLKPVAPWYFRYSLKPFSDNERIIYYGKTMENIKVIYSAIGALHVGSIELNHINLMTNKSGISKRYKIDPLRIKKGQELGRFNLGSCIVMAKESKSSSSTFQIINERTEVGEAI